MAGWLIIGVGVVYLGVALDLFYRNQPGLAIAFLGYAFSNAGLYMASVR